jgi:hypothetical protein
VAGKADDEATAAPRRGVVRSAAWQCHHCKAHIASGEAHDCWTTTEAALTADLSDDLRDAWERLRETAAELGDQRIYASGTAIMFSRKVCYCFVRPRRSFLELWMFLGRTVRAPQIKRSEASSRTKVAHLIQIRHRDEVESPITDWIAEAYALQDVLERQGQTKGPAARKARAKTR